MQRSSAAQKFVVVSGYGQFRPLKPNINDNNRALNRRVEVRILKDAKVLEAEEASKKAAEDKAYQDSKK